MPHIYVAIFIGSTNYETLFLVTSSNAGISNMTDYYERTDECVEGGSFDATAMKTTILESGVFSSGLYLYTWKIYPIT
jgi:hypothetical protein